MVRRHESDRGSNSADTHRASHLVCATSGSAHGCRTMAEFQKMPTAGTGNMRDFTLRWAEGSHTPPFICRNPLRATTTMTTTMRRTARTTIKNQDIKRAAMKSIQASIQYTSTREKRV